MENKEKLFGEKQEAERIKAAIIQETRNEYRKQLIKRRLTKSIMIGNLTASAQKQLKEKQLELAENKKIEEEYKRIIINKDKLKSDILKAKKSKINYIENIAVKKIYALLSTDNKEKLINKNNEMSLPMKHFDNTKKLAILNKEVTETLIKQIKDKRNKQMEEYKADKELVKYWEENNKKHYKKEKSEANKHKELEINNEFFLLKQIKEKKRNFPPEMSIDRKSVV